MIQWLQLEDVEKRQLSRSTWIPLLQSKIHIAAKEFGELGYRKDGEFIDPVIIFTAHRDECGSLDWQGVNSSGPDRAWADENLFHSPGSFRGRNDEIIGFYPILRKGFDTGEPWEWHLSQEIEFALGLLRLGDVWVRPEEDYIEVVRMRRDSDDKPELIEIRAEHLRDYLCARKAALLITGFRYRDIIEENLPEVPWAEDQSRVFSGGEWKGVKRDVLKGGMPVGSQTAVLHMWRESVNPADDVPVMPHPTEDHGQRSAQRVIEHQGPQYEFACGKIWWKEWIEPGDLSPRIRRDEVESTVEFIVDNQARKTLSGKALSDYRGWLWFNSGVISALLRRPSSQLKWYTMATGEIGPARHETIHFGVNSAGLINVLGYKVADLSEWVQRIWVSFNVSPEGGLSRELHASQNLAAPALTMAPEMMLWRNLNALNAIYHERYGTSFFSTLPDEKEFYRLIHRFYDQSFRQVCELAKELMKVTVEGMSLDSINRLLGPSISKLDSKFRQIKRLEHWFNALGHEGRKIVGPLVGINDLRQGDAHAGESTAKAALKIFGIPEDAVEFQAMNVHILRSVVDSLGNVAKVLDEQGAIT